MSGWNDAVIKEFRENAGRVGGGFAGAPVLLLHHVGRSSGSTYVAPMMWQAGSGDAVYVFASKSGAPDHPDWYLNLVAAGRAYVEIGTQAYDVTVRDLPEPERTTVYDRQKAPYPGFAEYEQKTAGVRVIPVLELTRA
jgi:deazaflavin-dependent oxidoreductase (nitroreductase family)